jgi:type IV pilus assembly protein PilQ
MRNATLETRRQRRTGSSRMRASAAVALALGLFLASGAPAQELALAERAEPPQQAEDRIDAGQLPSEADILESDRDSGFPLTINFVDTDIRDVATFFSNLTGLNIVVDPEVSGPVTVSFYDVPWDVAFSAILRSHQLGYQVEHSIVRVSSTSRLANEAEDQARLQAQEELATPLDTLTTRLSYADASEVVGIIESQLSARGQVMVDARTNQLIVKDTPQILASIDGLLEELDIAAPQVLIESRIVETTKEFSRELGIQWGFNAVADAAHGNSTGLVFPDNMQLQGVTTSDGIGGAPYAVNLPAADATSGLALTMGNILDTFRLDVALSAMEEEGRGKVISSPKVTAQDNIQASIESGRRIPVQTLVDNTASITFINANLQLQVTPQINAEGTIMLDIVVDKSEPDFGNAVLGIPTIFTRRAQTRLLVRDGGTTVIGGIFQMSTSNSESRVPFFHRIPLLGNLFKSRKTEQTNNELLIFITPRILEN